MKIVTLSLTLLFLLLLSTSIFAVDVVQSTITVSQAVAEALANNPSMVAADANIRASEQATQSSWADLLPRASFNYSYTSLKDQPVLKTAIGETPIANQDQYRWNVSIIQPLFKGFALRSNLAASHLDVILNQLGEEQIRLELSRSVRGACYTLQLAHKLLMVSQGEVQALTAHKKDAEQFYRHELIPLNDLLKSKVALADAIQAMEKADATVEKAMTRLNRLLNRPLTNPTYIAEDLEIHQIELNLKQLSQRALKERPLMRSIQISLEKLGLAKKVAQSTWYPEVSLIGSYEQEGDSLSANNNDYTNSHNAGLSFQLEWTFWDWGQTRAKVAVAKSGSDHANWLILNGMMAK